MGVTQVLPHWFECPEFLQVKSPVTGEPLWLLYGCYRSPKDAAKQFQSNSCYQLGKFDGRTFTPTTELQHAHEGPNFYGALTFNNQAEGRNIMMGWTRGSALPPGELFNQGASVPLELTLRQIASRDILWYEPVKELTALHGPARISLQNPTIAGAQKQLASLQKGDLLDLEMQLKPGKAPFTLKIRDLTFQYDPASGRLNYGPQHTEIHPNGSLTVRVLVDRMLVETFWNGGEAATCSGSLHTATGPAISMEGDAQIESLMVWPMKSIW